MNSRQKPPERLEKKLARVAREQGIDQERLRHWVSFLALCGVLERACHENILGVYYLKGGVAMELRFAQRARATKDLDLGMEETRAGRLQVLSEALRLGFDQFSFRLKAQFGTWNRRIQSESRFPSSTERAPGKQSKSTCNASPQPLRSGGAPCPLRQRGLRLGTCHANLPRLLNPFRPNWKSPFAAVWTRQSPTAWCSVSAPKAVTHPERGKLTARWLTGKRFR